MFPFQTQQVHAVLQGPGEDPLPHLEETNHAGQAGTHLQGTLHSHAVFGLSPL